MSDVAQLILEQRQRPDYQDVLDTCSENFNKGENLYTVIKDVLEHDHKSQEILLNEYCKHLNRLGLEATIYFDAWVFRVTDKLVELKDRTKSDIDSSIAASVTATRLASMAAYAKMSAADNKAAHADLRKAASEEDTAGVLHVKKNFPKWLRNISKASFES